MHNGMMPDRDKRHFVIFVVFLDDFDHFGQTFGDINVSIDSLTLDSPCEECRDTSFGICTPNENFWLKNANSFVCFTASEVFSTSSVPKSSISIKVLC
jgi:hypothetical protein